ncbi:uncharacterized protein LOC123216294 [Mangifera indica]|uniref:uncharacterized protein LOC123216294 n=1 Tax=Mangifera indica TaxID=29780 RepID=UPI001CFB1E30|nr:uncharacterized protein LOC123216294 [Mangifera indica]
MAFQAPTRLSARQSSALRTPSLLSPTGNAGLRCSTDRVDIKSPFSCPSLHLLLSPHYVQLLTCAAPRYSMRVASKQAYICRDCGYIYNDRTPFEKLADSFFCPVCGAPKRRFKPYAPAVARNANNTDVRKARKAQIQKDEAIGGALPIAIAVGAAALAGLYLYLNNTF